MTQFLPPTMKFGQGYVFTRVCDSVHRGGLSHCTLGYRTHPPSQRRHPPRTSHTPRDKAPPPRADTPPSSHQHSAFWEIRPTSVRYASYLDALLLQWLSTSKFFKTLFQVYGNNLYISLINNMA